jgi:hypothetical protein
MADIDHRRATVVRLEASDRSDEKALKPLVSLQSYGPAHG